MKCSLPWRPCYTASQLIPDDNAVTLAVSTTSRRFLQSMASTWAALSIFFLYCPSKAVVLYCWANFIELMREPMSVDNTFWAISIWNIVIRSLVNLSFFELLNYINSLVKYKGLKIYSHTIQLWRPIKRARIYSGIHSFCVCEASCWCPHCFMMSAFVSFQPCFLDITWCSIYCVLKS